MDGRQKISDFGQSESGGCPTTLTRINDKNLLKYIKESNSVESFEELLEGKSSKKDAKVITFPQDKISKDNVYTSVY